MPFLSTWVHLQYLVGFVLFNIIFFCDLLIIVCLFVFFQQLYCLSFSDLWLILIKPVVFSKFTEDIASPEAITNGHNYERNKIDVS